MRVAAFKKYLAVIFLLLIFIFMVCGCAVRRPLLMRRPLCSLRKETVKINREDYLAASLMCEVYGIDWQWDTISHQLILEKDDHTVILRGGSRIILLDGEPLFVENPPLFYKGGFFIPFSLVEDKLDGIFYCQYLLPYRKPIYQIDTIVIDPGHGGKDPGAIGKNGLYEKEVVLDISKRLKRNLEEHGIRVILTRDSDKFVSLWKRADIANKNKADFFISIHANASRYRQPSGFEVYYLSEACDDNARAVQAAENASLDLETGFTVKPSNHLKATLWDIINTENRVESIELATVLCESMEEVLGSRNRGVKSALFYVLKGVRAPAVLVEVAFISNKQEESKLRSASYRQRIADALATGILRYKRRYELTEGFTN